MLYLKHGFRVYDRMTSVTSITEAYLVEKTKCTQHRNYTLHHYGAVIISDNLVEPLIMTN